MEKDKESCLEDLKKKYSELQTKHGLPDFDEMNKDFAIEKVSEVETDFLLREIRRFVSDRFANYLRFIEEILHPTNASMFIFSVIKSLGEKGKEKFTGVYKKLANLEIELMELDISYDEEKEVVFVKKAYETWQEVKKDLLESVGEIKKNWDNKIEANGKGYFG